MGVERVLAAQYPLLAGRRKLFVEGCLMDIRKVALMAGNGIREF